MEEGLLDYFMPETLLPFQTYDFMKADDHPERLLPAGGS